MPLPHAPATSRPLVVSTDEQLLDDLLRLLAAAGAEPEVATGGPALRRAHRSAPLVLVGADSLPALQALPRRPGLVLVTGAEPPAADWAAAVELGAERVAVLPGDEAWLLSRAARAAHQPVERGRLAVVSGSCGGAGASTLATALALAAASRSQGALLVDADPYGGGLDLLLGAEREEGLRWPELAGLRGRVSGEALLAALPETTGVHVLAGSRDSPCAVPDAALLAVVRAGRAAGRPVVVDLPRDTAGTDLLEEAELVVMVVPARLRAACAARLLVGSDGDGPGRWSRAQIVVRRVPGGLTADDVADLIGREVLAELPHDRWAVGRGERGEPPGVAPKSAWGAVCRRLLEALDTDGSPR